MTASVTPTVDDVLVDVRNFCLSIVPAGVQVIKGIVNLVPPPLPTPGFVVMTPLFRDRLATNVDTYTGSVPSQMSHRQSTRIDIQLDVYGKGAGSWAAMMTTLWRDEYACDLMKSCQPLYMDDGRMMPLIDAESQYEERWCLVATAQYSPVVTVDQGFADVLDLTLVDVQERFPVE